MRLTTEDQGEIDDVDAAQIGAIFADDSFGKFVVLSKDDATFMQAGNAWDTSKTCAAFLKKHGSDPWVLEYRDPRRHIRATTLVSLEVVRLAFISFLAGTSEWESALAWKQLTPPPTTTPKRTRKRRG